MTVAEVFQLAGLAPGKPVAWKTTVSESSPGVYVVALVDDADALLSQPIKAGYLDAAERSRWLENEPVIYIGRTRQPLQRRLRQFYGHRYGKRSPHRGGQAVALLECDRWVYCSATTDPVEVERAMIDGFKARVGSLPFANRRR